LSRATPNVLGTNLIIVCSGSAGEVDRAMQKIVVWDVPTRLFHWLTVMLVATAYATWRLNWMDWHAYAGNALLVLVVFRLLWGFFGSETARFARFIAPPRRAACHPPAAPARTRPSGWSQSGRRLDGTAVVGAPARRDADGYLH
jgi:hypothetical protein